MAEAAVATAIQTTVDTRSHVVDGITLQTFPPNEQKIRQVLAENGVDFLPRTRIVKLPPIITDLYAIQEIPIFDREGTTRKVILPTVNMDQVRKIVPKIPQDMYEKRVEAVGEAIAELASYLAGEVMADHFTNHAQEREDWKHQMRAVQPDYDIVYSRNQLRGNKLSYVMTALDTIRHHIGNDEIFHLSGRNSEFGNVKRRFRQFRSSLEEIIHGEKSTTETWELPPDQRPLTSDTWSDPKMTTQSKIAFIIGFNTMILETLRMLSAGMKPSEIRVAIT